MMMMMMMMSLYGWTTYPSSLKLISFRHEKPRTRDPFTRSFGRGAPLIYNVYTSGKIKRHRFSFRPRISKERPYRTRTQLIQSSIEQLYRVQPFIISSPRDDGSSRQKRGEVKEKKTRKVGGRHLSNNRCLPGESVLNSRARERECLSAIRECRCTGSCSPRARASSLTSKVVNSRSFARAALLRVFSRFFSFSPSSSTHRSV